MPPVVRILRHIAGCAIFGQPMILTCHECRTRYRAEVTQFPPEGRKVRCTKCGYVWHQLSPDPETEPLLVSPTGSAALTATPAPSQAETAETVSMSAGPPRVRRRSWAERFGLLTGWAALVAMLCLIGSAGFRFRQEIATLWPQSSSMFATFGVPVNAHGIAINDWSYRRETENGQPVMVVTGRLVNTSAHELPLPPVRVTLTDDDQRELYHWTFNPPLPTLRPGQSIGFSTRLTSPPLGARHLQLRFAGQD